MKRTSIILLLFIISAALLKAQVIETEPGIPTKGQLVTIYFNSDELELTDPLYQYEDDLYAHTGVTIDGERWQNVIGTWDVNISQPKLVYLGSYQYKLEITPDIEHFYRNLQGLPISESEIVSEICLVLRNTGTTAQTRPDYFIEVFEAGLEVNISNPVERSVIIDYNETLDINVSASFADSISLFIDDVWVMKGATADQLEYAMLADTYGGKWVKAIAHKFPETAIDSFYYYVPGLPVTEALPGGVEDGINYNSDTEVTLVLAAPGKGRAFVIGDFNEWLKGDDSYMKVTPDGTRFWKVISGLTAGTEYRFQYVVDDIVTTDPYCEKILDPWNDSHITDETYPGLIEYPEGVGDGIVGILQTAAPEYEWQTTGYTRPAKTDLVVYELLLRDFLETHNYETLIDTLPYLAKLGINAIELMPVNEFDGNLSWGYNPSFYFAPDKYYGTKNKLKEFIDSCHTRGIAVIVDMVLNHATGNSPLAKLYWDAGQDKTAADNPWFNVDATHDYNVFHDLNHESDYTRAYSKRVMKHWIEEYKVDGYRFDLSKGFTQNNTVDNVGAWGMYDASRVAIWEMYADYMWSIDPDTYVILEHFAENSEETVLTAYGMMVWGNLNGSYTEAAMGYNGDINWASYLNRGWTVPHNIVYMESHDEERMQFRNTEYGGSSGSYNTRELATGLKRDILAATFFFTIPGPKMIWQFGELGYDYSIDYNGRTGEKPIKWDYYSVPERQEVYRSYAALAWLKRNEDAFRSSDFTITETGKLKRIAINDASMDVRVIGNFDLVDGSISADFSRTGKWYEFFTADSLEVSNTGEQLNLEAGEYRLYTTKRLAKPDLTTGIDDIFSQDYDNSWFSVYPNPVSDISNINISDASQTIDKLELLTLDGRLIFSQSDFSGRQLNLSGMDEGIYLLRITSGTRMGVKRIIKLK